MATKHAPIAVVPIAISELNCEAATGRPWRAVRELARRHGLARLPGKIPVYRADALLALFADESASDTTDEDDELTSAETVLARLGRRMNGVPR